MVRDDLLDSLRNHPAVRELAPDLEHRVREGELTATLAAERILGVFRGDGDAVDGSGDGDGTTPGPRG